MTSAPAKPTAWKRFAAKTLHAAAFTCALMSCTPVHAQADSGCPAGGYRILARTWDVVLKQAYELRQSCAHPDWPVRSVAVSSGSASPAAPNRVAISNEPAPSPQPLLVHAGDPVRLWMQSEMVRIEISGQAE